MDPDFIVVNQTMQVNEEPGWLIHNHQNVNDIRLYI